MKCDKCGCEGEIYMVTCNKCNRSTHTQLPWHVQKETLPELYIGSKKGLWSNMIKVFASPSRKEEAKANAEFIERACNNHYKLVETLNDMVERWEAVTSLFNGKEYNNVRPDTSIMLCKQVIEEAEKK